MKILQDLPQIKNYQIEKLLYESDRSLVYRGNPFTRFSQPFLILTLGCNRSDCFREFNQVPTGLLFCR